MMYVALLRLGLIYSLTDALGLNSLGPVAQYHENSKYYSAVKPAPNPIVDANLPHITIEMPVYKESLKETMYVLASVAFWHRTLTM